MSGSEAFWTGFWRAATNGDVWTALVVIAAIAGCTTYHTVLVCRMDPRDVRSDK